MEQNYDNPILRTSRGNCLILRYGVRSSEVESFGDNLQVHTTSREIRSRCTIAAIEKALPEKDFIRIHRSFIIALGRIRSFSPVMVDVEGREFPIGTSYRENIFKKLDYDSFLNK